MTNVPNQLRDMWADLYRLFDSHYLMENTVEAWAKFLNSAKELWEKYGQSHRVIVMINVITDMIADRIDSDKETANAERE